MYCFIVLVEITDEMSFHMGLDGIQVSVSVFNHCEGRPVEFSVVFSSNVPVYVIIDVEYM